MQTFYLCIHNVQKNDGRTSAGARYASFIYSTWYEEYKGGSVCLSASVALELLVTEQISKSSQLTDEMFLAGHGLIVICTLGDQVKPRPKHTCFEYLCKIFSQIIWNKRS